MRKITALIKPGLALALGLCLHVRYWLITALVLYVLISLIRQLYPPKWMRLYPPLSAQITLWWWTQVAPLWWAQSPLSWPKWPSLSWLRQSARPALRLTAAIAGIFLFTGLAGAAYQVPSDSMAPTIQSGDYLWCNKLAYGTVVDGGTTQFLLRLLFRPSRLVSPNTSLHFTRLFALSAVQRNDIVLFKSPGHEDETMVKRIVGLPGESIAIRNGQVLINSRPLQSVKGQVPDTSNMAFERIPYKGMTIPLTRRNLQLYQKVMEIYEGSHPEEGPRADSAAATYTFLQDYYFALGDNRPNSKDSRSWGFVPERYLIGKAALFLFTTGNDKNWILSNIR